MKSVMGIDNGTQSTKVIIYDYENKKTISVTAAPHDIITDSHGTREQKAEWWITALKECLKDVDPAVKASVQAIGISGQQHGFVPVDKDGNVLYNVKLWNDTATVEECKQITEAFGGEQKLIDEVGNPVVAGFTAPKILWLKNHKPELYAQMDKIMLPHDYLNFYLTGEFTMEYGDASGTALLNIKTREWHKDLIKAIDPDKDLLACLPEKLIGPNDPAGKLTAERAAELGLPEGIVVSCGGGDNMMGAIGTGTVKSGFVTMSLGTSGTLYGYADQPVIDPKGALAAFCSSTGGWLPLLCTMNCTVSTELTRDLFEADIDNLTDLVSSSPIGAEGIITLPFYNGERTPNLPNGKGCVMGMDMDNFSKANMLRSSMESAIFGLRMGLDSFEKLGFEAKEVRLIGGGSKNSIWRQIVADVMNLPVVVPEQKEAAAFGGALQALSLIINDSLESIIEEHVAIEEGTSHTPNPEAVSSYEVVYQEYNKYLNSVTEIFA